ncbi:MAG TPA: signal peptidase I [Streptosporangiaceae bacterium]|nr:signal peptidase I [Streptosporangiaceae bacterium]
MASTADHDSQPAEETDGPKPPQPLPLPRRRATGRRRALNQWITTVAMALLLALGVRTFVFQGFDIPTGSMEPTLDVYDRILVDKFFFNWHDVHQGDIVVFTHPPRDTDCSGPENTDLVKRVIALPGQTVYSSGNTVYVNGRALSEPYLKQPDPLGAAVAPAAHPFHVPAGEFYVMGDNRQVSCDSRVWGPIKGTSIVGKVVLRWWHNGLPDFHLF